jgi:hypothetical protein
LGLSQILLTKDFGFWLRSVLAYSWGWFERVYKALVIRLGRDFENKVSSFHHVQETSGMAGKVKKLQHTASEIRNHKVLLKLFASVTMKATLDIEAKKE